jgi:hypothetical protein
MMVWLMRIVNHRTGVVSCSAQPIQQLLRGEAICIVLGVAHEESRRELVRLIEGPER